MSKFALFRQISHSVWKPFRRRRRRPHRIVYAKSLTFRTFLDIQPKKDSLTISLRKGRNESTINHKVKTVEDIESVKPQIANAYENIK